MKSAFNTEIARSIKHSAGRFVAIAIISLLGAGFYAGLRQAAPDMRIAGDDFFSGCNLYDISVTTTYGLDDKSLAILGEVSGVGAVMPAYRANAMVRTNGGSYATVVESLPIEAALASDTSDGAHSVSADETYLNRPILLEGEWPAALNTCVIGADAAQEFKISIGDTLIIEKCEGDLEDTFAQLELTVTGLVNSPAYASSTQLGVTPLGTGSVEMYLYVRDEVFSSDLPYSMAYLSVPSARGLRWASAEYDDAVSVVKQRIVDVAGVLADERYNEVKDQMRRELFGRLQEMTVSMGWVDDLDWPEVFVMDRSKNAGAAQLKSDADGITQIATFLPFMFFLVAALVSLTSMTRMVDEERLNIGTHKALGYSAGRITSKYLIYGVLSSGVGSVVGVIVLGKLLPWFIMSSYAISYAVPTIPLPIDPVTAAKAIGLSVGITALATVASVRVSLRERPATLMLPRAPKAGKRIFLERIRPLWNRFSFSQKVTARNLLRYKRRFFMAVAGVAGCTALLMVGFGLRDAIGSIVSNQYEHLIRYDVAVQLDDDATVEEANRARAILDSEGVDSYTYVDSTDMVANRQGDDLRVQLIVPQDAEAFSNYVTLRDRKSLERLPLEADRIVLTEKAASELGAGVGDEVTLFDENDVGDATGDGHTFVVGGVTENYLGHYAYLLPEGYRNAFGEQPRYHTVYLCLNAGVDAGKLGDELLSSGGVSTVSFVSEKIGTYEDMLGVMNKLIYVIVLLSAALAFVVLYNLTNINIAERVREIATLKVLGFTRGEVNAYIFREIMVMAVIGALIGCVLGVPLTFYIAQAAETPQMMFGRTIEPMSFVLSFAITMAFSAIVAFTMRRKLARVNMVESLKSVD